MRRSRRHGDGGMIVLALFAIVGLFGAYALAESHRNGGGIDAFSQQYGPPGKPPDRPPENPGPGNPPGPPDDRPGNPPDGPPGQGGGNGKGKGNAQQTAAYDQAGASVLGYPLTGLTLIAGALLLAALVARLAMGARRRFEL